MVCELAPVREHMSQLLQMRELVSDRIDRSSPPSSIPLDEDLDLGMKKSPPPAAVINPIHGGNHDIKVSGRPVNYILGVNVGFL